MGGGYTLGWVLAHFQLITECVCSSAEVDFDVAANFFFLLDSLFGAIFHDFEFFFDELDFIVTEFSSEKCKMNFFEDFFVFENFF